LLLCGISGARRVALSCWVQRCHRPHRFSRRGPAQRYRNLIKMRPRRPMVPANAAGPLARLPEPLGR
jgi:hypothetical protein